MGRSVSMSMSGLRLDLQCFGQSPDDMFPRFFYVGAEGEDAVLMSSHNQESGAKIISALCQALDCRGHLRCAVCGRRVGTGQLQFLVIIENIRTMQMHDPEDVRVTLVEHTVGEGFG